MCGIAGVVGALSRTKASSRAQRMMGSLAHGADRWSCDLGRGGRQGGVWSCAAGDHRSDDRGPADDCPESGCVITYNGEIYNYVELRDELGALDIRTNSDTEVILRAYEKWGEQLRRASARHVCLRPLGRAQPRCSLPRSVRHQTVLLPGITTRVYFASEVKALLPFVAGVETDVRRSQITCPFNSALASKTLFTGITNYWPGHCGFVDGGTSVQRQLVTLKVQPRLVTRRELLRLRRSH